jgi:hypothetical protein
MLPMCDRTRIYAATKPEDDNHEEVASVVSLRVDGLCFDCGACVRVRDRLRARRPGVVWAAGSFASIGPPRLVGPQRVDAVEKVGDELREGRLGGLFGSRASGALPW